MQRELTAEQARDLRGAPVFGPSGEAIGEVESIYVDRETGRPNWFLLGSGRVVPVSGSSVRDEGIYVPYTADDVAATPEVGTDEISPITEEILLSRYGLGYEDTRTEAFAREESSRPPRAQADEAELVRSEEELQVAKQPVEAGRVRVRKWVETEPVSVDVELQREIARIVREPLNQAVTDVEIGEAQIEVALHAEQPIVQKQAVAKERIWIQKDVEVTRQTVTDELRKERVEVEEDGGGAYGERPAGA